jgi:anti-sigma factor ChrR (cupin superfamily)
MASRTDDYLLHIDSLPWHSLGEGSSFRLLRHNVDTGQFVIILRIEAGGTFLPHRHYGAAEFLMLKGALAYTDKVATPGDYGWEGMYAEHDATSVDRDTELLFIGYGPIVFNGPDGRPDMILDGGLLANIAAGAAAASFTAPRAGAAA